MTFRIALILAAAVYASSSAWAQTTAPAPAAASAPASEAKRELAGKLVALQRGPEMERMVFQLTSSAVQPVVANWSPKLEALPEAKREKAREQLNAELKVLGDSIRKIIETQMGKSSESTLLPAYIERFSEDEMKHLVTLFESPAFKKYQGLAPELGNAWVKDVIEKTRPTVLEKDKAFETKAAAIIGTEPADKKPVAKKK